MREEKGTGIVHKSDNEFNINVMYYIKLTKQTKNEEESIAILSGAKDEKDVARPNEKIEYVIEDSITDVEQEENEMIEEER